MAKLLRQQLTVDGMGTQSSGVVVTDLDFVASQWRLKTCEDILDHAFYCDICQQPCNGTRVAPPL
jgi:hypothetical protein